MVLLLVLLLGFASAELYTATPAGWVYSDCVHGVPSGTVLDELPTGELLAKHPNGDEVVIPLCKPANGLPVLHRNRAAVPGAPEIYDGWTAYTEFNISNNPTNTFDKMLGNMSVPNAPVTAPQQLYLFPGLQNINWVPVVDSPPTTAFDIIQPVLQYPGDSGFYWSVKSWYVTLTIGTVYSAELRVSTGDIVYGLMQRQSGNTWLIECKDWQSGKSTNLTTTQNTLQYQPWAYTTVECYGCNGCKTYPTQPELFTGLKLYQGSTLVTPVWQINPQPSKDMQCNEHPVVVDAADITMDFQ